MGLATILDRHYKPGDVLGFGNRQNFEADLEAYRKRYGTRSLTIFILALLLVGAAGYAAFRFIDDPDKLTILYAATGITLAGALEALRRVSREWGRIDLLITLLKHADDDEAVAIVKELKLALRSGKE